MPADPPPLVLHLLHDLEGGGTARQLVLLLQGFDRSRLRHAVVTLRGAGLLACHLPDDVSCQALQIAGRSWTCAARLAGIARQRGVAILHARNTGCWSDALVAGWLSRHTRVALGFHGVDDQTGGHGRWLHKARRAARFGARLTTVAHARRNRLIREANMSPDTVAVLPNGVDLKRFVPVTPTRRQAARAALDLPPHAIVVGAAASLTRVKRLDLLIQAGQRLASEVFSLHLVLIGEGPLRAELEALAQRLGIADRVRFAGARPDVENLLPAMDVYVCASESEEVSNAFLEAMATGLPVVTTDVGDHARIVRSGLEGFVVGPGDADGMARAICDLALAGRAGEALGTAARARAEAYGSVQAVRTYEDFYTRMLVEGHRRPAQAQPCLADPDPSINRSRCPAW